MARAFASSLDYIAVAAQQWPQTAFTCNILAFADSVGIIEIPAAIYGLTNAYFQFFALTDNSLTARVHQVKDTTYIGRVTSGSALSVSTWTGLGFTWSGGTTNAAVKIYVAGAQADTANDGAGSFSGPYSGSDLECIIANQGPSGTVSGFSWTGKLAEFGLWNVALDAAEMAALNRGYSPLLVRPQNLIRYDPLLRENVSPKGVAPTIHGTTISAHPRVIMPWRTTGRRFTKAVGGGFVPAWASGSNLPVLGTGNY